MSLPDDILATAPVFANYVDPYTRHTGDLEDWEQGGIALNDPSLGLDVQMWYLWYNDDEDDPNYGDFTVRAETTGETAVIINVPNVIRCGLAFNQNNDPFICYEMGSCEAKYYYWNTVAADYVTDTLPVGSKYLACCLDDHRYTNASTSDTILAYVRGGTLYYRQERDRFGTERALTAVGAVGGGELHKVGMTENLRLKFDIREGRGQRLSEIQGDIFSFVGLRGWNHNVAPLYDIWVRGFIVADAYTAADTSRVLQRDYFYDLPQVDYKIEAVLRGGSIVAQISQADCVKQDEISITTARGQGVEYPRAVHYTRNPEETDYTPTKVTSERRSPDIRAVSELTIDSALNIDQEEAAQIADKIHKTAWNEVDLKAEFALPEDYAFLIPSNLVKFEVRPNVYKRIRIDAFNFEDGYFKITAFLDRGSSYYSGATGVGTSPVPGEPILPVIAGPTTWHFMDLPALVTAHDTLRYYVAGRGDVDTGWHGAQLQRQIGTDWQKEGDITTAEVMGQVEEVFPSAPIWFTDETNTLLVSLNESPDSYTTDTLLQGKGAWAIQSAGGDWEIIQVRTWVAEGANWRGSYIYRGRLDTPCTSHAIGEKIVYLGSPVSIPVDGALLDTSLQLRAASYDTPSSDATDAAYLFTGRSQEEWAPMNLTATRNAPATNDWTLTWVPRYRLGNSANPIPSSNFYGWRLTFTVGATVVQIYNTGTTTPSYTFTEADQITGFGSAQSTFDNVEIRALNHLGGEGKALNEAVS